MKIDVNSPTVNLPPVDSGTKKISARGSVAVQDATQDRTTFHTDTLSVQSLTTQALNSPEVRQAKVDALSLSVKSGEYKVDSTKTAGAMIDSQDI
jgi:flagellar biosynthesis anti-sigma factor FlgM